MMCGEKKEQPIHLEHRNQQAIYKQKKLEY